MIEVIVFLFALLVIILEIEDEVFHRKLGCNNCYYSNGCGLSSRQNNYKNIIKLSLAQCPIWKDKSICPTCGAKLITS